MAQLKEQPLIYSLMDELHDTLRKYQESLDKDEIFESRKKLHDHIRALQLEIQRITKDNPIDGE